MKIASLALLLVVLPALTQEPASRSAWRYVQSFEVAAPGLVKARLPLQILDRAQPGLADLRVRTADGRELPCFIDTGAAGSVSARRPASFDVTLLASSTVVTLATGTVDPLQGLEIETGERDFLKSARIEGSTDGTRWQGLAENRPLFRRGPAEQLRLELPRGPWAWLRVTLDDRRSPAIALTGARLEAAEREPALEAVPVTVLEQTDDRWQTRLVLALPAANLRLARVTVEVDDALFAREVTLFGRTIRENELTELALARGCFFRLTGDDGRTTEGLSLAVGGIAPSREIVLTIQHGDNPPLRIRDARIQSRSCFLVFHAEQAGRYQLLAGNREVGRPDYDLQRLAGLALAETPGIRWSGLLPNPDFDQPAVLPEVPEEAAPFDDADWAYRKRVFISAPGVQRIETDLEMLARTAGRLDDLRLVRNGRQIPFVYERPQFPLTRQFTVTAVPERDEERPSLSRWRLSLPHGGLPLKELRCQSATPLFRREIQVWEWAHDDRRDRYRRPLGAGVWVRSPDHSPEWFSLSLDAVASDTLFVETDNGDNPRLELAGFELSYPVGRVVFKVDQTNDLFVCYGNRKASPPQYDLSLVAGRLLAAEKARASLGPEERLAAAGRERGPTDPVNQWMLWIVLVGVALGLVLVIVRFLPKPEGDETPAPKV
ncbi:MAG: DUF3999 family protein [Limisphaerales bacterium]